jgi:hypothetical protein
VSAQSQLDGPQTVYQVPHEIRKILQSIQYRRALEKVDVVESYRSGKLALILDLVADRDIYDVWPLSCDRPSVGPNDFALLILHNNVSNPCDMFDWDQKIMLIPDIQSVKGFEKEIPTAFVGLHFGNNYFEEFGAGRVYFSCTKRTFNCLLTPFERNLRMVGVETTTGMFLNGSQVGVLDGDSKIVNGITKNYGYISADVDIRGRVAEYLRSGLFINLDSGRVDVWQRGEQLFQVRDVLIGPLNLDVNGSESVHIARGKRS